MYLNRLCIAIMSIPLLFGCGSKKTNPFFETYNTPFGVPPFDQIRTEHFLPAFEEGLKRHESEISTIAKNSQTPTFANTIEALEFSGELLTKVSLVFDNLLAAETNDSLQEISKTVSPLLSEHYDQIVLNEELFARIKVLYQNKDSLSLNDEAKMLLDNYYKKFVRAGALLSPNKKERLKEINKDLALLSINFGENKLKEFNNYQLIIDKKEDLKGLPLPVIEAASEEAESVNLKGKWIFTLHSSSRIPFLQYSANRLLREKLYKAYVNVGNNNDGNDNKKIIQQLVNLRIERANLLGFASHADYVLDNTMAKTAENVNSFLNDIWQYAIAKGQEEADVLQKMIREQKEEFTLQAWDWPYYSEMVRTKMYALDEQEVKPYFKLENVRAGAFMVAEKIFNIKFLPLQGMPVYHKDVEAFEVQDVDGTHLGVFYVDYFPRPGKSAGAWMSNYREQAVKDGKKVRPVVVNVCNFTKPTADTPSLLTMDEVETLFHEFGHALHGLLANTQYPSISGTNVKRDFVELPSQIMEHWSFHPQVLKLYAKHFQTGEIIPDSLIEKMSKAQYFNQGFMSTELVAASILDMGWHTVKQKDVSIDVKQREKEMMSQIGLIPSINPRYASTYFSHIFDGGYSSGYYSYLWAEVLDADAFSLFEAKGIFDLSTGMSFRKEILEKGGTQDPMSLYLKFRGSAPKTEALLRNRGLK